MKNILFSTCVGLFGFCGHASADQLSDCDRETHSHHAGEADTIDLGAGYIAHKSWGSFPDLGSSERLVVTNCVDARFFFVLTRRDESELFDGVTDITSEADALLMEAVASNTRYDLEALQSLFNQRFAGRVEGGVLTAPSCGCEIAYPQYAEAATNAEHLLLYDNAGASQ